MRCDADGARIAFQQVDPGEGGFAPQGDHVAEVPTYQEVVTSHDAGDEVTGAVFSVRCSNAMGDAGRREAVHFVAVIDSLTAARRHREGFRGSVTSTAGHRT